MVLSWERWIVSGLVPCGVGVSGLDLREHIFAWHSSLLFRSMAQPRERGVIALRSDAPTRARATYASCAVGLRPRTRFLFLGASRPAGSIVASRVNSRSISHRPAGSGGLSAKCMTCIRIDAAAPVRKVQTRELSRLAVPADHRFRHAAPSQAISGSSSSSRPLTRARRFPTLRATALASETIASPRAVSVGNRSRQGTRRRRTPSVKEPGSWRQTRTS